MAAVLLCARSTASVNGWSAIGPAGGMVNRIAFSATPNTVFAIAAGGFYRSRDNGVSWQLISNAFFNAPSDLALDPSDPTRVYVTAPNLPSLYVSTDGGSTLAAAANLPTALTQASQVAVSQDGATLYVSSGALVFCSPDRGQSWAARTAVGTDPIARVLRLRIDPTDSKTVYAAVITSATGEAILATHDGGVSWSTLVAGSAAANVAFDLAINASNPLQLWAARLDGVWMSADRGITWTEVLSTPAATIVIDSANPAVLYAGAFSGQVLRSADSGAHWTDVTGNLGVGQVATLAVNPAQDSQLLVGGIAGLAGSGTAGATWTSQQSGVISTSVGGFSADPTTDRIYIDVPTAGIYYEAAGSGSTLPVNESALQQLLVPPINLTSLLAEPGGLLVSLDTGLARSADGGTTWSLLPVVPSGSEELFAMASPAGTPQTILAASDAALYRSTNGGAVWTQVTAGLPANAVVSRLFTAPSDPSVAYGFLYAPPPSGVGAVTVLGVYRSADAGATWAAAEATPASGPTNLLSVDPTTAAVLYGSTDSALLKSSDGGATWAALNWDRGTAGIVNALAVDPLHPQILYASSVTSIARSVDGGASWQTLRAATALPVWSSFSLMADPLRPENLLVATLGSGVQQFTVAPDLSIAASAPAGPVAVGVAATYVYAVANAGPFDATGVRVSVQLPATAQHVSAAAPGGTCGVTAAVATCVFGVLRTGSSATLTVNATAPAAGTFSLAASVQGDQPDADTSNNAATTAATAEILADLSLAATGTAAAQVGGAVEVTFTVNNAGPDAAPTAQVSYQLAAGLTPGTVTTSGATCVAGTAGLISCALANVAVATPISIRIEATAAVAGAQSSKAFITTSSAEDSVTANNDASLTTTVTAAPVSPPQPPSQPPAQPPTQSSTQPPPQVPASSGGGGGGLAGRDLLALMLLALASRLAPLREASRRAPRGGVRAVGAHGSRDMGASGMLAGGTPGTR